MRCVAHPSSYPMSTFKELYNKLLAINYSFAKIFGCLLDSRGAVKEESW